MTGQIVFETEGAIIPADLLIPEGTKRETRCWRCETVAECVWGPNPYAEEVWGVDTPHWECIDCLSESAQDI